MEIQCNFNEGYGEKTGPELRLRGAQLMKRQAGSLRTQAWNSRPQLTKRQAGSLRTQGLEFEASVSEAAGWKPAYPGSYASSAVGLSSPRPSGSSELEIVSLVLVASRRARDRNSVFDVFSGTFSTSMGGW